MRDANNFGFNCTYCIWLEFWSDLLHPQGMLDDHDTMIRIIVSRSEVDLQKIIQEYKRMYGKVLQQDVLVSHTEILFK